MEHAVEGLHGILPALPPEQYEPMGQGDAVLDVDPGGQKEPGGAEQGEHQLFWHQVNSMIG